MTSDQWRKLRRPWHMRSLYREMAKEHCYGLETWRYGWRFVRHDVRTLMRRLRIWLVMYNPLRCNGNRGGWRTRVCEWLESKTRGDMQC